MSDTENEYVEPIIENTETTEESNPESVETENKEPEVYKPWEKKEKSAPDTIPYSRFSEVNRERRELEKQLLEREMELSRYKQSENKVKEVKNLEDIKLDNFETFDDYQKARDSILVKQIEESYQRQAEERENSKRIADAEANIIKTFENRIAEAAKANPEITNAVDHIAQFAEHIPASVRYALLTDDNAGEVAYEIATTPGLLEFLIKANVVDSQRKIDKISAKFDFKKESASKSSQESIPTSMSTPSIKTPKTTNGSSSSVKYLTGNESPEEYRRKRMAGYQ